MPFAHYHTYCRTLNMPGLPVLSARSTKTHRHIDTRAKPVIKIFKKNSPNTFPNISWVPQS